MKRTFTRTDEIRGGKGRAKTLKAGPCNVYFTCALTATALSLKCFSPTFFSQCELSRSSLAPITRKRRQSGPGPGPLAWSDHLFLGPLRRRRAQTRTRTRTVGLVGPPLLLRGPKKKRFGLQKCCK